MPQMDPTGSTTGGLLATAAVTGAAALLGLPPFGQSRKKFAKWRLVYIDPPWLGEQWIEGQFIPEGFTRDSSTVWATMPIPTRQAPHEQWVRGESETITFEARFWAQTPGSEEANKFIEQQGKLQQAIYPDPSLGRPPRFRFEWGVIAFDCVVTSVGAIRYDELWADGSVKGVTYAITLRRLFAPLPLLPTDPSAPIHDSRFRPMAEGNYLETVAQQEYQSPLLGIFLRQDSKKAFPGVNDLVKLPIKSRFINRVREPKSYPLSNADVAKQARIALFNSRSSSLDMPFVVTV